MVGNITSLTNNGLRDWLIQRVSAVVIGGYILFLAAFILAQPHVDYVSWHTLFSHMWMKLFTLLCLLSLVLHAWIGVWTVTTDYLNKTSLRLPIQMLVALSLIAFFAWGIAILWGIG